MRFMLLVIAAIAIAASARAHDWWGNDNVVDQATKSLCCGQNDCKEVPAADVIQPGADHRWHFRDTHFAIDVSRAMPSPDGRYRQSTKDNRQSTRGHQLGTGQMS
jgi:hypothetical protein